MLGLHKSYSDVTFWCLVQSAQKSRFIRLDTLCKNNYNAKSLRNTKGRAACVLIKHRLWRRKNSAGGIIMNGFRQFKYKMIALTFSTANIMAQVQTKEIKMINESNASPFKHVTKAVATAVIAFVLIFCIFATTAFAGMAAQYNVCLLYTSPSPRD